MLFSRKLIIHRERLVIFIFILITRLNWNRFQNNMFVFLSLRSIQHYETDDRHFDVVKQRK